MVFVSPSMAPSRSRAACQPGRLSRAALSGQADCDKRPEGENGFTAGQFQARSPRALGGCPDKPCIITLI